MNKLDLLEAKLDRLEKEISSDDEKSVEDFYDTPENDEKRRLKKIRRAKKMAKLEKLYDDQIDRNDYLDKLWDKQLKRIETNFFFIEKEQVPEFTQAIWALRSIILSFAYNFGFCILTLDRFKEYGKMFTKFKKHFCCNFEWFEKVHFKPNITLLDEELKICKFKRKNKYNIFT